MMVVMLGCSAFYMSTLEEYYTGGLFLLVGNGVTDGSGPIITIFIVLGFTGNDFFMNEIFWGFKAGECVALGVMTINASHLIWAMVTIL